MTLTITIADDKEANRMVDGLCAATKYDAGSGKSKGEWVKAKLADYLKQFATRGEFQDTAAKIRTEIEAIKIT